MIEQLMKAVKRGNKKRSINITIGTVVGFLLSCTAVMGADDNYLWIKEDGGAIKFNTGVTTDVAGTGGNWSTDNTYTENAWNAATQTYTNNMALSSNRDNGNDSYSNLLSYGLRLSGDLRNLNFINNGSIIGTGSSDRSYGIYNYDSIGALTNTGLISGANNSEGYGIYSHYQNSNIGILMNSGLITGIGRYGYGVYNGATSMGILTNIGLISGIGDPISNNNGYGITNSRTIETLINTGLITGMGNSSGYAISNRGGIIEILTNSGLITGTSKEMRKNSNASGIWEGVNSSIEILTNNGLIVGKGYNAYGVDISGDCIKNLTNIGLISGIGTDILSGFSTGYGIYIYSANMETLTNNGIIFGTRNAIMVENPSYGTINLLNNYGILATQGYSATYDVKNENNYGLYITETTGIVTAGSGGSQTVKFGNSEREMIIENAVITGGSGKGTSTESFTFSTNPTEFDNSILNGKNEILKVTGTNREVKGSVINAYGTAVKFDTAGGEITLTGTIVNGGIDAANDITVSGSGNGDTLILQSGDIAYTDGTGTQNTIINGKIDMAAGDDILTIASVGIVNGDIDMGIGDDTLTAGKGAAINGKIDMGVGTDVFNIAGGAINGDIDMGAGADTLTIEAGSIINGILDGGTDNDILNFNSAVIKTSTNDEINIINNISGFENMNINTDVTIFEKTVGNDGNLTDLTMTDAENITIGVNGVLTLRINSADNNKHALQGNTGTISSTGGKLLLALNGAGNESIISFGATQLDNSLVIGGKGNFDTTSKLHTIESIDGINNEVKVAVRWNIPEIFKYKQLNKIYHGIISVDELGNFNVDNDEKLSLFLGYLNDIYAGNPYSYSSELSRKSMGMFRDIVTECSFKPETNKWMIYGGLTHVDGGTKDTYYGKGYYTYDIGSPDIDADIKITGAYMLGEYGISDTLTSGVIVGGNKLKSDLSNGSKAEGNALYLGAYAKKYIGNLKVTAGAGFQYGNYDVDRLAINTVASDMAESVMKYSDNYNDISYDIYLNGRYSHSIGDNLFLEPYGTLSYTHIKQDGADEGNKALAIETDSKSFDYTSAKVGADIKKVMLHKKGKSTLSAGVNYTRLLNGAEEEYITGRFIGGSDFDILVAHKNEHSLGLNAKYTLELENGILFDVKGNYAVERDSHNGTGKNRMKGEWIIGTGLGYKF